MSPAGYARPISCAIRPPEPVRYTVPRTVAQLMIKSEPATSSASRMVRSKDVAREGTHGKKSTPATARGTAPRKPRSAKDGKGTCRPTTNS